jgi:hypothetical protein
VLANVKNSLLATHRAVGAKHLPRYLGAFAWRFNRRFVLKTIHERLAIAATTTPPMPYRLLKLAEPRWRRDHSAALVPSDRLRHPRRGGTERGNRASNHAGEAGSGAPCSLDPQQQ